MQYTFPVRQRQIYGKPLVYLDNAATTHPPTQVLQAVQDYYHHTHANVHRSVHHAANQASNMMEGVRKQVAQFIHAPTPRTIIFTSGTTASLNLVAQGYGLQAVGTGDEVLVSQLEHHSNWLPWHHLCQTKGATLRIIPITPEGVIDLAAMQAMLSPRTKLVALTHVSNVLGTQQPIQEVARLLKHHPAKLVVDAAQSVAHMPLDVQTLACDFLAFSAHKMYGLTGTGILYVRTDLLATMSPIQLGGGMVQQLTEAKVHYEVPPYRLEAGTPNLVGIAALGAAIDFIQNIGWETIQQHERTLTTQMDNALNSIKSLTAFITTTPKVGVTSFYLHNTHALDAALQLDARGIALRAGQQCAQPLMHALGIDATLRASLALYNTPEDIQALIAALATILN